MLCQLQDLYLSKHLTVSFMKLDGGKATPFPIQATGFFVRDSEGMEFLVTNRHVLDPRRVEKQSKLKTNCLSLHEVKIEGHCLNAQDLPEPQAFKVKKPTVSFHAEQNVDIAVFPSAGMKHLTGAETTCISLHTSEFLGEDDMASVMPGRTVHWPGYPGTYSDSYPLVRAGHIASDPRRGYGVLGNKEAVAIDGFLTEGASGSPVLLDGCDVQRLLGAMASFVPSQKDGQHYGVSVCMRSCAILECLKIAGANLGGDAPVLDLRAESAEPSKK